MAKLSVTVAVTFAVLLFFLTVSQARIPSNLPENDDVNGRELPLSRSDSDVSSALRLPSDSVNDEPHSTETAGHIPESESISVRSIPLRVFRFRPINRHFPIGPRFPFHNCHHHLRRRYDHAFFKPIRQQQPQQEGEHVEIPYGNDMILSTGENNEFDRLMFNHGRMRRIPAKWVNFHHHHHHDDDDDHEDDGLPEFFLEHSLRFGKEKFMKHLHHYHEDDHEEENEEMNKKHLHHHHEDDHEEEENEEMKERKGRREEKDGGFMNRIRKFLDHF